MKKLGKQLRILVLAAVMLFGSVTGAFAAFSDFSDVEGHWAEATLERAYNDGLLQGYEDSTMRPGDAITTAQMITILCRVLGAQQEADISGLGLPEDAWYREYAAKALYLGLITGAEGDLNAPMSRLNALLMTAKAFQLTQAEPDTTLASGYSDFSSLSGANARTIASLVNAGYIIGYDGSLHLSDNITRAEFVTLLYRIAENYLPASEAAAPLTGGSVLSGDASLVGRTYSGAIWTDCTAQSVSLTSVTAPSLTIRSHSLSRLSLSNVNLERLTLANGSGNLTVAPSGRVTTLAVGDGSGSVTVASTAVRNVEVIGSGRTVTLNTALDSLVIAGDNNTITLGYGVTVGELKILGSSNTVTTNGRATAVTVSGDSNTLTLAGSADTVDLVGRSNSVTARGAIGTLSFTGQNNAVSGTGRATTVNVYTRLYTLDLAYTTLVEDYETGIALAEVTMTYPNPLPAGETLTVSAAVAGIEADLTAHAAWYIDGTEVQSGDAPLTAQGENILTLDGYDYTYTRDMPLESTIALVLTYTTEDGEEQSVRTEASLTLENYDDAYYDRYETEAVLAKVTNIYQGNYTTQWAIDNDLDTLEKEIFVNAKGYSSATEYLVWVNLGTQHVNIFTGSQGNWTLDQSFLCGTGAPGSGTPQGTWTILGRQSYGWTTGTYNVRPVVYFYSYSYAFHSRLYDPSHSYLTDPSIGFPVSAGCIRMYDEDVWWMYDNLPDRTTVVVY